MDGGGVERGRGGGRGEKRKENLVRVSAVLSYCITESGIMNKQGSQRMAS